ncbi:hypothetical protein AG1IA_04874 [Rhizoctonia solani AG-1 IA]|uniref:Uncharacterized protein n=1 Tax=Thanatephorus cucumeris (strain AG1-IA) TaxID=983506 RepID=L8WWC7_THACA|nr:hypothetical protein AG1IA_04874 [Rhizoctonia solani AG-1 IA]
MVLEVFVRKLRQSPLIDDHQLYADIISIDPTPSIMHRGTPKTKKHRIQVDQMKILFFHRRNSFTPW